MESLMGVCLSEVLMNVMVIAAHTFKIFFFACSAMFTAEIKIKAQLWLKVIEGWMWSRFSDIYWVIQCRLKIMMKRCAISRTKEKWQRAASIHSQTHAHRFFKAKCTSEDSKKNNNWIKLNAATTRKLWSIQSVTLGCTNSHLFKSRAKIRT